MLPNRLMSPEMHAKLVMVLTEYDRRQSKSKNYNRYALALYFKAIENVETAIAAGKSLEDALPMAFCGPLLRYVAKKLGLTVEYSKWQ